MTSQVSKKVRLVRCPVCRNVLPELPEVSVYKCGGCGTVLQAKNRKLDAESSSQERDSVAKSHLDNVVGEDDRRSLNRDENEDRTELCQERSSSTDVATPQVKVIESPEYDLLGKNPDGYQKSMLDDDNGERSVGPTFSDELCSSGEITPEDEACNTTDASDHAEDLQQDNGIDQTEHEHQESSLPERIKNNYVVTLENDEKSQSCCKKNQSLVSLYLTSDGKKSLDHSQSEITRNFETISSIDTLGSLYFVDQINGSYDAYDGSESSYDGTDDQIRAHISHPSRENNKKVDSIRATEGVGKDGSRRDNVVEREWTYGATGSSYRAMRSSQWSQGTTNKAKGYKPSYSEPDKLELLRTVYELKEQLHRMHFTPFHYDHNGYNYQPQHYHAEGCAKRCNVSRVAFSGEAAHDRHCVSCSYSHCCPQDWHHSVQLPSCNCCSVPSSPSSRHCTSSELSLWGRETNPDYTREKYRTAAKRHLWPVAGGAPIVACYHCSELLQLPADFLLFQKRYHRLMCNACKKVLKFSVLRGAHIVPYVNDASAPLPESCNDAANWRRNLERVSYFDEYEQATEGEASAILPSPDRVEMESFDRKMSSGSSFGPMEDRKMKGVMKEPRRENDAVESVGASSRMPKWRKFTSEIEQASPGQVLNK